MNQTRNKGLGYFLYQKRVTNKDKKVLLLSRGALVDQNCQCLLSKNFSPGSQRGKRKWEPLNAVVGMGETNLGKATNTKKE